MSAEPDLATQPRATEPPGRLLSVTVPAPGLTARDFLSAQTGARFYWNRDDESRKFGERFKKPAEITGGVILVLIALKIVLEHTGLWF